MDIQLKANDASNISTAHLSAATKLCVDRLIHLSGQIGADSRGHVPPDYESQIHLALLNLRKAVIAKRASICNILQLSLHIVNSNHARRSHTAILERFLGSHRPAIHVVLVSQLAGEGVLFQVDAVLSTSPREGIKSFPSSSTTNEKVDVVVIGAGLAGLAAAHRIVSSGLSCLVLEARDRVGGRTWSHPLPSGEGTVDLGAAWINDTNQSRMIELARRYGAELIEQNTIGNCAFQDSDGGLGHFSYGELPNVYPINPNRNEARRLIRHSSIKKQRTM
jgi:monoamine oxidase